jgi:hypothetical protein
MSMEEELDCTNEDLDQLDRGNQLSPGWYRAVLHNVVWDHKSPGTLAFTFAITAGPFARVEVTERLWNPENSNDTDTARKLAQRRITFAKRLGLIDRTAAGTKQRIDWQAAVGMEVGIKMVEKKDKDGVLRSNLDWAGVYQISDERVPALIRGSTVQLAAQQTAATQTAPPHRPPPAPVDYGSL